MKLLIHFDNFDILKDSLEEHNIELSEQSMNLVQELHNSVKNLLLFLPAKVSQEICYRIANRITKLVTLDTGIKLESFKKHEYQ